jgi:hypothetical protein
MRRTFSKLGNEPGELESWHPEIGGGSYMTINPFSGVGITLAREE